MAGNNMVEHKLRLLIETELSKDSQIAVGKKLKSILEGAAIGFDEAETKKNLVPIVNMIKKLFDKAEMKFDADKLFAMPSQQALQTLAQKSADEFQMAFDRALAKSGGVKIDFGNVDLSGVTEPLERVVTELSEINRKIANETKKSVDDIELSLKRLNKVKPKKVTSTVTENGVTTEVTREISKAEQTAEAIEKTLSAVNNPKNLTTEKSAVKELDKARAKYEESVAKGDPWEIQYQHLISFVSKYEAMTKKIKPIMDTNHPEFKQLYDILSPKAGAAKISLEHFVNVARNEELAEYKNMPWGREATLKKIEQTLRGGISVKDSGGDNKDNGSPNEPPKPTPVVDEGQNKEPNTKVPAKATKPTQASDTSAFNQKLFDAIEKLSKDMEIAFKSMFDGDIDEDQLDDKLSELRSSFLKQFKFNGKQGIDDYLAEKSDDMGSWDSKKIYAKLSKKLKPEDPSWPKIETDIADSADTHVIDEQNAKLEKQAEIIELINSLVTSKSQKEKFAYLNTQTGDASKYIEGTDDGVSVADIKKLLQNDQRAFDSTLHTHPSKVAVPSPEDFKNQYIKNFDIFKRNFILATNEIAEIDFSQLTEQQAKDIYREYKERVHAREKEELSLSDMGVESVDLGSMWTKLESQLNALFPDLSDAVHSYIEDLKKTVSADYALNTDLEDVRGIFDEKSAEYFQDKDASVIVGGMAQQVFDQTTGAFDALQKMYRDILIQSIQDLGYDVAQIFKTYNIQDFVQQIQSQSNAATSSDDVAAVQAEADAHKKNTTAGTSADIKASIDTEELRQLLSAITYKVQVVQDTEPADDNKVSINVEELRSVLDGITYNVKLAQGETDSDTNKISIDEGILESTLKRVFANILSPADKGDIEHNEEPWALEKTLSTTIKSVLDQIQTNTAKIGTAEAVPSDTNVASEATTKLVEIKSVLESIDTKIANGGVIATRGSVKQAGAQAAAPDTKAQTNRSNAMRSLVNDYKTMGKLAAQFASDGNLETKAMLENLKEEIRRKRASLNLTMAENASLREKYSIAFDAENKLLEAEKQQKAINDQNKADAKAEKKRLADAKKLAQREAMVGKAGNAVGRAENTWMTAVGMEDELPKGFGATIDDYYKKLNALRKKQAELKNSDIISEEDKADLLDQTNNVNRLTDEIGGLIAEYQKLSGSNATVIGTNNLGEGDKLGEYEQQLKQAVITATNGKAQIKSFDAATKTLTYTVKTGKNEFTEYTAAVRRLDGQLVSVQGATKKTETFFEATKRKMKEISSYMSGMALFSRAVQELRRGIQYVREIDLALTELRKVTSETKEEYDQFLQTAATTGARLGTTISAVTEATATFAKLGYTMEQATEMAESAIVYKNVGDNIESTGDAADSIISTLKGFGLEVTDTMKIVDSFNEVGNRFAITSQGIGEALRLSASALNEGGNSLHESIGLITAANEVVNDPSSVGTALKTLTLRLRGSKTELEEMGEDVSDMATTTSALQAKLLALTGGQVDIMLDENTFKNSTQILREMADAWEDMNDIQRASALELMGGKRQANVLSALIQNFDTVERVIETSANSAGSALKENERYLDSIQGKIDQFNNAMQAMWSNTLDSDWVKGFVNFGTILVKIIDKIGLLNSALIALATYSMIKNKMGPLAFFGGISDSIKTVATKIKNFTSSIYAMVAGQNAMAVATDNVTVSQFKNAMAVANVDAQNKNAILSQMGLTGAANTQKISQDALTASTISAMVAEGNLTQAQANTIMSLLGIQAATNEVNAARMNEMLIAAGLDKVQRGQIITQLGLSGSLKKLNADEVMNALTSAGMAKADAEAIMAKLGLTVANKGLAASFMTLWTAMWPILAVMAGIAAIYGVVKLFDAMTVSAKEASEQLEETQNKISDLESELESLQTELDEAREKIAELTALPRLSLTQQEDLDRLEREVELLERQIALKERQLAIEEAKLVEDAELAVKKNWGPTDKNKKDKKDVNEYIDTYSSLQSDSKTLQGLLDKWEDMSVKERFSALDELNYNADLYHNISAYDNGTEQITSAISKADTEATNLAAKIEGIFADATYSGLTYGMSDEIDAFLDDFNNAQLKWEKALYGDSSTASTIESLWGPNASEEMKAVKSEIDRIMAEDGNWANDDEKWQSKNDAIKNYIESLDETADGYHQLDYVMNDLGVTAQDVADYFTVLNGEFNSSTIEGITGQYQKGMEVLEKFKNNQTISYTNQDGVTEQVSWEDLFDWDEAEKEATANADVIAKVLKGADKETREQFGRLVETVAEGNLDFEQAIKSFGLSGSLRGFKLIEDQVAALNADIFKDLDDEISGVIDTFSEFGAALESVANSMEILNTAQTQMNNSGRISVKTALDLINSTDRWNEVLKIENGNIKLVDNAEEILIQTKLDHIKTNLQAALSTVNAQLAQIEATGSAEELATTLEESTNMAVRSLAENMSYLSTLVGEFAAGNWRGATKAAADAKAATANQLNYKRGTTSNISTTELQRRKGDIEAQLGMLEGIDTTQEFKNNYDFDKTPGDKYDDDSSEDDAFQRAMDYWENRIGANQARYEQLQNEIDLLESKGQKADASYYEEQIKLENERLSLLQQQKAEAQSYLGTFAEGSDEWWEVANTLNGIEGEIDGVTASIQDLQTAISEVEWYKFDEFHKRTSDLHDDLEAIRTLIATNGEEDWFDDNGDWTEEGVAVLGSYVQDLAFYEKELENVNKKLSEQYSLPFAGNEEHYKKLGIDSEQELYDTREKLKDQQYDYAKSISDTEQSIVDMYESNIDAVDEYIQTLIDGYSDYIDSVKEALDAERDLFEFKKNVQKQSKDMAELERRISSLSGSTNAADIAERRKLEAELYTAREGLNDTYYDHAKDAQNNALDAEQSAYEETMNKFIEGMRTSLETATQDMDTFLGNVTTMVSLNAGAILAKYQETELPLDDALTNPWEAAKTAVGNYSGDALELMNTWAQNGFLTDFPKTVQNSLESPWTAGQSAVGAFKTSVDTQMAAVVAAIETNVKTASSKLSELYKQIEDTEKRAVDSTSNGSYTPTQYTPYTPPAPTPSPSPTPTKTPDRSATRASVDKRPTFKKVGDVWSGVGHTGVSIGKKTYNKALEVEGVGGIYYPYTNGSGYKGYIKKGEGYTVLSNGKMDIHSLKPLYQKYAKGTIGTTRDEWAITDEKKFGDELVLVPGKDGNLSFMRKGTGVVPADLTANLMEWGQFTPDSLGLGGGVNVNMINNAVNKPEFNFAFDALVKAENITEETLPAVKKLVTQELNRFTKELNYALKSKGAR